MQISRVILIKVKKQVYCHMKHFLFIVYGLLFAVNGLWAQVSADEALKNQNIVDFYKPWVDKQNQLAVLRSLQTLPFQIKQERIPGINYPEIRYEPPPPFAIETFQDWKDDARFNYLYIFREVHWKPILPELRTALDTLPTQLLRAKLQAKFGNPAVDMLNKFDKWGWKSDDEVEFTYFLTANDSIPLMVTDINGPYEEGLVLVGSERDSTYFPLLKAEFVRQLLETHPVAYKSYYKRKIADKEEWISSGYTGTDFFLYPIPNSPLIKPSSVIPPNNRRENNVRNRNRRTP